MLHIIFVILKIIGIIILSFLALILFLGIIALTVPVRYRGKAKWMEEKEASFTISWLLHFITIRVFYQHDKAGGYCKILGIPIYVYGKPKKEKKRKEKYNKNKDREYSADIASVEDISSNQPEDRDTPPLLTEPENKSQESSANNTETKKKKGIIARIKQFFCKIQYTIKRIYDKIKKIIKDLKYYKRLFESEVTKEAIQYVKNRIFRLLNHIKPRKLTGHVLFGLGNPEATGKLLGFICIFYPKYGKNIEVNADFEEKILKADVLFKGRIRMFTVLRIVVPMLFHKNLRLFLKRLKKED